MYFVAVMLQSALVHVIRSVAIATRGWCGKAMDLLLSGAGCYGLLIKPDDAFASEVSLISS